MRVSTLSTFFQGLRQIQDLQSSLAETQEQIATQRRILRPSDDPIAAARSVGFKETLSRLEQFDRNGAAARSRLSFEEAALTTVNDVLQRVRELALRANNSTQTRDSRAQIAVELREQVAGLVQIANQKDGNGRYLFGGTLDGAAPVSSNAGGVVYNGDQGQRLIQIGPSRYVADGDSGADVFFNVRNGNGVFRTTAAVANTGTGVLGSSGVVDPASYDRGEYTVRFIDPANYEVLDSTAAVIASGPFEDGQNISFQGISFTIGGRPEAGDEFLVEPSRYQSVFETIGNIVAALDTAVDDDIAQAVLGNEINAGIQEIDLAIANVSDLRTKIGTRLTAIEAQADSNGAAALLAQQSISEFEDLDYAEALSRLSLQSTVLEAAQQSFVVTQRLSLFQFL